MQITKIWEYYSFTNGCYTVMFAIFHSRPSLVSRFLFVHIHCFLVESWMLNSFLIACSLSLFVIRFFSSNRFALKSILPGFYIKLKRRSTQDIVKTNISKREKTSICCILTDEKEFSSILECYELHILSLPFLRYPQPFLFYFLHLFTSIFSTYLFLSLSRSI